MVQVKYSKVPITGFLLFGLLSSWIYTAFRYPRLLLVHFDRTSERFDRYLMERTFSREEHDKLDHLMNGASSIRSYVVLFPVGYLLAGVSILTWVVLTADAESPWSVYTRPALVASCSLFFLSTAGLMIWSQMGIKRHEYLENERSRFLANPQEYFDLGPDDEFIDRWEMRDNELILFLLCSLLVTFSPWIASVSIDKLSAFTIVIYSGVVLLAATFHLWGTRLLVNLYNSHVAMDHEFPEPVFSLSGNSRNVYDVYGEPRANSQEIEIDGYRLIKEIGRGGMAAVYLAEQRNLGRLVALKIMSDALHVSSSAKDRFLREARIIAQLSHPNIVTIHEVGESHGHLYIAMEYLDGGDLKRRIRNRMSPNSALLILKRLAAALQYAHQQNYVHRDIKPENVLISKSGKLVITDFGIAKSLDGTTQITQSGVCLGTPAYMAPELFQGVEGDHRSDLYSLGVLFYQMLTGRQPYRAPSLSGMMYKHTNAPIPKLPYELRGYQRIVDKLMAKNPEERAGSAAELVKALTDRTVPPQLAVSPA